MKARRLPISSNSADSREGKGAVSSPELPSIDRTESRTLNIPHDSTGILPHSRGEPEESFPYDFSADNRAEAIVDGRIVKVKILVENDLHGDKPDLLLRDSFVGVDGNKFYCQVCGGFGEIVCCDGCPRVFHPDCIAPAHPSRRALDRDEDPWFCPECLENPSALASSNRVSGGAPSNSRIVPSSSSAPRTLTTPSLPTKVHDEVDVLRDGSLRSEEDELIDSASFDSSRGTFEKRKRPPLDDGLESYGRAKSKSKKRRTLSPPGPATPPLTTPVSRQMAESEPPNLTMRDFGLAQATPAFYFYLTENRWKIERALARNHRYFNRLPKGEARNALVAKEAALWWTKLRPADHRRYMNMSMRDFESQIIEWKEDKNLKDMGLDGEHIDAPMSCDDAEEEEKLVLEKKLERYMSTSVGSKPFNPEADQYYNRVLLDLLHDTRFHPLPLFDVSRTEEDMILDDQPVKLTIPHFEVHGPVSTSVGDECLGCTRGWLHYCPVLQRRVPAVEHRAKLQPPVSSLLACRVGLALRPRFEAPAGEVTPKSELFEWTPSSEFLELTCLSELPSSTLDFPNDRIDEVTRFIEDTMAMKAPEPESPLPPTRKSLSLPSQSQIGDEETVYKCGRCRTIVYNDTGCVQCRRAQLVINTTKRTGNMNDRGARQRDLTTVRTAILGRVTVKDGMEEKQARGDAAVSSAMLRLRWGPNAILPPEPSLIPRRDGFNECQTANPQPRLDHLRDQDEGELAQGVDDRSASSSDSRTSTVKSASSVERAVDCCRSIESNSADTEELHRKALLIACCGIFMAFRRRDPLLLFAEPANAEGYSAIVQNPIDLGKIKHRLLHDEYKTLDSFVADLKTLCENALSFNASGSVYFKTASQLLSILGPMHAKAIAWMNAVTNAIASEALESLRLVWPDALEALEHGDWLTSQVQSDFTRTKENERAYYGGIAVRRVAAAAAASLAPYTDSSGLHSAVPLRSSTSDEDLRAFVDKRISGLLKPMQLKDVSTWREEGVVRLLRKVQSRRLDRRFASENGCSRCDSVKIPFKSSELEQAHPSRGRRKGEGDMVRVETSRMYLTTGMGSAATCDRVEARRAEGVLDRAITDACTSVRGSRIHGWGLFADQKFAKGDFVAEYVGEYVTNPVADAREKIYQRHRIQDYQFRLDGALVVDATLRGCDGRYINHNCNPNCISKIIPGSPSSSNEKRVVFIALRDIDINEEITYDYQFPLEMNLQNRIPCNCQSDVCRGFMNWDIPEKGSNRALLIQKRGANMRDRIRRLGRPLKRDEGMTD